MTKPTPFRKLLVANRGEIAMRIIRTAKSMGYSTVAVYSAADVDAEHVRIADEAIFIGEAESAQSYLRVDAIINAAKSSGSDAVHPGYGFLAENAELPAACSAAGIIFVGPEVDAIQNMGDKARAKALMFDAGVPCIPGYQGEDQSDERLLKEAIKIGFPVMIKATAGGGGRGMRLVENSETFVEYLNSARSEAQNAFGNDAVLLEKAILNPRHVEIQVIADRYGNTVHLGERDCSVQRRHQKLIEEAPSPVVDDELRARMGRASVKAANAIGYAGAGTFEYLLDTDGSFYFMEMNTRLQVEHPVTEMITGLDIVELQLRVAAGERLPLKQEDVAFSGHAIEVRLCAEDPTTGFMPQSGKLAIWKPSNFIRTEHALRSGSEIPPHYDSMIAKHIAHGTSREDARRKVIAGLKGTQAMGLRTNKNFLIDCLEHPIFAKALATTAFIAENAEDLTSNEIKNEAFAAMVAAAILRASPNSRLTHGYSTALHLSRNEVSYYPTVWAMRDGHCLVEMPDSPQLRLEVLSKNGSEITLCINGIHKKAVLMCERNTVMLEFAGRTFDFLDRTFESTVTSNNASGDGKLRASMNGKIVSVNVTVGEKVVFGQVLVVVEAMKMEHSYTSPFAGTVTAIHAEKGAQVMTHAILVEMDVDQ